MSQNNKKKIIIGTSVGAIALVGLGVGITVPLVMNRAEDVGEVSISSSQISNLIRKLSVNNVQTQIDALNAGNSTNTEFNKWLNDRIQSEIKQPSIVGTIMYKSNYVPNEFVSNTYLKIDFVESKTGKFVLSNELHQELKNRVFISTDKKTLFIDILNKDENLEFWNVYTINNIKNANDILINNIIKKQDHRYTFETLHKALTVHPGDSILDPFYDALRIIDQDNKNYTGQQIRQFVKSIELTKQGNDGTYANIKFNLKDPKLISNPNATRTKFAFVETLSNYSINVQKNESGLVTSTDLLVSSVRMFTLLEIRVNDNIKETIQDFIDNSGDKMSLAQFKKQLNTDSLKTLVASMFGNYIEKDMFNLTIDPANSNNILVTFIEQDYINYNQVSQKPNSVEIVRNHQAWPVYKIKGFSYK